VRSYSLYEFNIDYKFYHKKPFGLVLLLMIQKKLDTTLTSSLSVLLAFSFKSEIPLKVSSQCLTFSLTLSLNLLNTGGFYEILYFPVNHTASTYYLLKWLAKFKVIASILYHKYINIA